MSASFPLIFRVCVTVAILGVCAGSILPSRWGRWWMVAYAVAVLAMVVAALAFVWMVPLPSEVRP